MTRASRLKQTKIYIGKCFRVFLNERGWKTFVSAAIITLMICMVTSKDMFRAYMATRNGAFALVCACIWIGIFQFHSVRLQGTRHYQARAPLRSAYFVLYCGAHGV